MLRYTGNLGAGLVYCSFFICSCGVYLVGQLCCSAEFVVSCYLVVFVSFNESCSLAHQKTYTGFLQIPIEAGTLVSE